MPFSLKPFQSFLILAFICKATREGFKIENQRNIIHSKAKASIVWIFSNFLNNVYNEYRLRWSKGLGWGLLWLSHSLESLNIHLIAKLKLLLTIQCTLPQEKHRKERSSMLRSCCMLLVLYCYKQGFVLMFYLFASSFPEKKMQTRFPSSTATNFHLKFHGLFSIFSYPLNHHCQQVAWSYFSLFLWGSSLSSLPTILSHSSPFYHITSNQTHFP